MTTLVLPEIDTRSSARLSTRVRAWLFAAQLDKRIDDGAPTRPVCADTPMAVHLLRLTSPCERRDLAAALRMARPTESAGVSFRVPVHAAAVRSAADLIDELIARLRGPHPVHPRGMARLRILLADGSGPLYRPGPASLKAALRGVLAVL